MNHMDEKRVRISDIAEELGLSTATVSNVIHGKTQRVSDETVKKVQELLEKREYIPSMAGILLAQNDSASLVSRSTATKNMKTVCWRIPLSLLP